MASFKSHLVVEDDFGIPFILTEPLIYQTDILKKDIIVPAGYETDLASIPIGLWNILPKSGRYDRGAVIHDFLYQYNGCTRAEADLVLDEAMGVLGVGMVRRFLIYRGVQLGGWKVWNEYRSKELTL